MTTTTKTTADRDARPRFYSPLHPDHRRPLPPDTLRAMGYSLSALALEKHWSPIMQQYVFLPAHAPLAR